MAAFLLAVPAFLGAATLLHTQVPFAAVTSNSMTPTIKQGDLLVVEGVNTSALHVGDIIVYKTTDPYLSGELIVHRIVKVYSVNGEIVGYVTKGDNNPQPDNVAGFEPPTGIPPQDVVGKVVFVIPLLGYFVLFLKQPLGFLAILIVVCLFLFLEFAENKRRA